MSGDYRKKLIELNEKEYGESYGTLRWVSEDLNRYRGNSRRIRRLRDREAGIYLPSRTQRHPPYCVALSGTIGKEVYCSIYERRSSVCREFEPAWQDNRGNPRCNQARLARGLEPVSPDSRHHTTGFLKAA